MATGGSSPFFVGRKRELAVLESQVEHAQAREPSVTVVVGDAGVGKTRLVRELRERASSRGLLVLRGECLQLAGGEFPYAPVSAILTELVTGPHADLVGMLPAHGRDELAQAFPMLEPGTPDSRASNAAPLSRPRLYHWLLSLLRVVSVEAPMLLVLEDLHWADPSTQDLLSFLVRSLRTERVALVVTVRGDDLRRGDPVAALLADITRHEHVVRLDLEVLAPDELKALIAARLGRRPSPALVREIVERSEGNPFLAEELLAARQSDADRHLPRTLRDTLLVHVHELQPGGRRVLAAASAIGRPADYDLLAAVAGLPEDDVVAALHDAVDRRVLEHEGETFSFRHALLREAVYGELLSPEKVTLHRLIARALEADGSRDSASERAFHWHAAGDGQAALTASVDAGLVTESRSAFSEAEAHFRRALELWPADTRRLEGLTLSRLEVTMHAIDAARASGDYGGAAELCRDALNTLDAGDNPADAAALYERLGRCEPWKIDESLAAYAAGLRLVPSTATAERARLLSDEAMSLIYRACWRESRERAQEALAVALWASAKAEEASARSALGIALAFLGDPAAGAGELREAQRLAARHCSGEDQGRVAVGLAEVLRLQGRYAAALDVTLDAEKAATLKGVEGSIGSFLAVNAVEDLFRLGRWGELERRLARLDETPLGVTADLLRETVAGHLAVRRGDPDQASPHLARARELWHEAGPAEYLPGLYTALAELELDRNDPSAARVHITSGLRKLASDRDLLNTPMILATAVRVEVEIARGAENEEAAERAGDAARLICAEIPRLLEGTDWSSLPPEAAAYLVSAQAELTRLDTAPDPDAWNHAAGAWAAVGQPYHVAYARWRQAEAVASGGARSDAVAPLRAAHAMALELGAVSLERATEALARRARIDLAEAEPDQAGPDRLPGAAVERRITRRELQVLELVCRGLTNREISEELFISHKTTNVHVSSLLSKLDVPNRLLAADAAERLELVERAGRPNRV